MEQVAHVSQLHERRQSLSKSDDFVILRRAKREFLAEMHTRKFLQLADHPAWEGGAVHFEDRGPHDAKAQAAAREVVAANVRSTGRWFKVDGHRRAHLWQGGVLPRPDTVRVRVIEVSELEDLDALRDAPLPPLPDTYEHQPPDLYTRAGIALYSFRLREGHISEALRMACRGVPINRALGGEHDFSSRDAVEVFRDELVRIDTTVRPSNKRFPSGVLAAALMTAAVYPTATQFWATYAMGMGHQVRGRGRDPVAALERFLERVQDQENGHRLRNAEHQRRLLAVSLKCFELWRENRESNADHWLKRDPTQADVDAWVEAVAQAKPHAPDKLIQPE